MGGTHFKSAYGCSSYEQIVKSFNVKPYLIDVFRERFGIGEVQWHSIIFEEMVLNKAIRVRFSPKYGRGNLSVEKLMNS